MLPFSQRVTREEASEESQRWTQRLRSLGVLESEADTVVSEKSQEENDPGEEVTPQVIPEVDNAPTSPPNDKENPSDVSNFDKDQLIIWASELQLESTEMKEMSAKLVDKYETASKSISKAVKTVTDRITKLDSKLTQTLNQHEHSNNRRTPSRSLQELADAQLDMLSKLDAITNMLGEMETEIKCLKRQKQTAPAQNKRQRLQRQHDTDSESSIVMITPTSTRSSHRRTLFSADEVQRIRDSYR